MDDKLFWLKSLCGLPWWRSGWESACQCRGHRFEPWSVKIPHAAEQLGPWAAITEPAGLEPVLCNKRGRDSERPAHRDEEWPPLAATRESPRTETKTQHSQKKKKSLCVIHTGIKILGYAHDISCDKHLTLEQLNFTMFLWVNVIYKHIHIIIICRRNKY